MFCHILVTEEDISNLSRKAKIAVSEYKQQTLKAMAGESRACFDYEVKSVGSNTVQLVWKKVIENDDIKVSYTLTSFIIVPYKNFTTPQLYKGVVEAHSLNFNILLAGSRDPDSSLIIHFSNGHVSEINLFTHLYLGNCYFLYFLLVSLNGPLDSLTLKIKM